MKKIALLAALAVPLFAHAATMTDYATAARWTDANGITQFQGKCSASWGPTGADPAKPLAYDLHCGAYKPVHILVWEATKLASIDGLPARASWPVKDTISLYSAEGERLTFALPNCTKDAC